MRHRVGGFKLQRDGSARRALLRGLTTSLILEDRIVTTVTKAKAVRPTVEKMITLAKRDTLHARRQAAAYLLKPEAVKKLFEQIGPRFSERPGGYTRIVKLSQTRKGDGSEQALIELLGSEIKRKAEERRKRREERIKAAQEAGEQIEEEEE
jgi:large subunit ribosomal protein L17